MSREIPATAAAGASLTAPPAAEVRTMQADFITVSDVRWRQFLDRVPHDVYHRPEYIAFCAVQEGGEPLAFLAEDGEAAFLLPLLRRPLPAGLQAPADWCDVLTPYGYPAPLMRGGDAATLRRFLAAFAAEGRGRGIVSAFIRLHPLLPLPMGPLREFGEVLDHGQTVVIDLGQEEGEIWRGMRDNHRRDIRRLQKMGYMVRIDDWQHLADFVAVYRETMIRLQAGGFYLFAPEYFSSLRSAMGEMLHLCCVLSPEGRLASAGLFIACRGILQYHLGGTAGDYLAVAPSKLMFDHMWRWGKGRGEELFHLGGGLGGRDDSLFRFKEGFSRQRADFFTCRAILDADKYAVLLQRWRGGGDRPALALSSDFFPIYRCPRPDAEAPLDSGRSDDID